MPKFSNKEEYEKWKTERLQKISESKEEIESSENNISIEEDKKTMRSKLGLVSIISIFSIIVICSSYYYVSYHYQPKHIAEDYLKAIQLHDIEKMQKLGIDSYLWKYDVLINLLDWKFINAKYKPQKKVLIDLSETAFKRERESQYLWHKDLSDQKYLEEWKQTYAEENYEKWKSEKIANYIKDDKAFEDNGNYYYIEDRWITYLVDITAANKIGSEIKKKYLLTVRRQDGQWKVSGFCDRDQGEGN